MSQYKLTITFIIDPEKDMSNAKIASSGHLAEIKMGELNGKGIYPTEISCVKGEDTFVYTRNIVKHCEDIKFKNVFCYRKLFWRFFIVTIQDKLSVRS